MTARYTRGILAVAGLFTGASILCAQTTPLQIVTASLPPASAGVPYNQQLVTSGGLCLGNGSASSTIDAGALPPGLTVTSPASVEQWFLQGTPSAAGSFSFTVRVRWTHTRITPFQTPDCFEDAVKTLTLTVQGTSTSTSTLVADRSQITTTYHTGQFPPGADTVTVSAAGGGTVPIMVQSVTDSGGVWLSVTTQRTTTPAAITISYSVSGLTAGTYTGRVTVTPDSGAPLSIPVTLQVVTDTNIRLQAAPSSLAFTMVAGSADPPTQSLRVTVVGANVIFQAIVSSAPPNGKWLTVKPTAALTPATLDVAVTAKDLPVGVYNGFITLAVPGVPNGSFIVSVTFAIQAAVQKPTISAGGVVNAGGLGGAISPGTWISIFGTSLATTTRGWRDADFVNGRLPTVLDGVSVTINGKAAAVAFVSPLQINVLAPDDVATGLVPVQVRNTLGTSDSVLALQQTVAPSFFQVRAASANYAAGVHADGSTLAGPALAQQGIPGTPARVGETIVLFGTGFGATDPATPATSLVPVPLPLARPQDLHVRIGGLDATIEYAGLILAGVYQFNVVVPQVGAGDQQVVAELRGLLTQSGLLLTIQQ